ncbi:MAG: hypothetical protein Q4F49_03235 [Pseudoxanthomonas suwonensis]|nr:hypothetical protein [Pseudoxanthomonas suwonensis]
MDTRALRPQRLSLLLLLALPLAAWADDPVKPEIERPPAAAQPDGQIHTLRVIPEACTRLEGRFTGDAGEPYQLRAVQSAPQCQPRARLVDAAEARPEGAAGWILHDRVQVPSAACPGRVAVLDVWRKPGNVQPLKLDAQGRARVYLDEAKAQAASGAARAALPQYAVRMGVEGEGCH